MRRAHLHRQRARLEQLLSILYRTDCDSPQDYDNAALEVKDAASCEKLTFSSAMVKGERTQAPMQHGLSFV